MLRKEKNKLLKMLKCLCNFYILGPFFLFILVAKYFLKVDMKKKFNTHSTTFKITHNELNQYEKCQLYLKKDMYEKVVSLFIIAPK